MTSSFSPPTDRRAAAGFVRALLNDPTAAVRALVDRADTDPDYRLTLISGLGLSLLDEIARRHRGDMARVREELELSLLDTQLEVDGDD